MGTSQKRSRSPARRDRRRSSSPDERRDRTDRDRRDVSRSPRRSRSPHVGEKRIRASHPEPADTRDATRRQDADRGDEQPKGRDAEPVAEAAADKPNAGAAAGNAKKALANRTGGVYIPPFKLARMMQEVDDKSSAEYQRMTWDALRKSINGLINKVNTTNIQNILPELFQENIVRGRGLLCRSIMKSQMASPGFTPVYAALMAVINTKFPEIGELLLQRIILQFRRAYKRNDKPVCIAVTRFLAHLVNQGVLHEVLALELLILMLETPSDDSVEMACEFSKEVGAYLQDVAPQGLHSVFERFREILHEGEIDKRVQFMIEGLFAIRKAGFANSGFPSIKPELDLVEAEDQITHQLSLEDKMEAQLFLDVFKVDPEYVKHESEYEAIKKEVLGEESEDEEEKGSGSSDDDSDDDEDEQQEQQRMEIQDATETNLVNLRRTIYLTIMSSMDFEEAGHKLLKIQIQPGQENELVHMIIECATQERTFYKYYGLLAQRFCYLDRKYTDLFAECFEKQYMLVHRLETNKLRNVAKLFAHLLSTDAIPWTVLACIRITEHDTTSSSRIFIKYLFQELSEGMGLVKLNTRLQEPSLQEAYHGIFPKDTPANLRFAINFFTSIGLGGITDTMREYYQNLPKLLAAQAEAAAAANKGTKADSSSSDDSSSGSDDSSPSGDDSSSSSSDGSSSDDSDSESGSGSDSSSSDGSSGSGSSSSDGSDSDSEGGRKRTKGRKAGGERKGEDGKVRAKVGMMENGRGRGEERHGRDERERPGKDRNGGHGGREVGVEEYGAREERRERGRKEDQGRRGAEEYDRGDKRRNGHREYEEEEEEPYGRKKHGERAGREEGGERGDRYREERKERRDGRDRREDREDGRRERDGEKRKERREGREDKEDDRHERRDRQRRDRDVGDDEKYQNGHARKSKDEGRDRREYK